MSESTQLQEMMVEWKEMKEAFVANGHNGHSDKEDVPSDPCTMWRGKREPLTNVEAFAEFIMNVFDLSVDHPDRKINMCISSVEKPKDNVVELNFWDDGPGLPTGGHNFLHTYMKLNSKNKADNNKKTIGDAGIGAKTAAAKLGSHWHFSWSEGKDHPICHWIADEDNWETWHDYDYYEEEVKNKDSSFFNLSITKLHRGIAASKLRSALAAKFAGTLRRHPNISIYTCRPDAMESNSPLTPPPPDKYVDNFNWNDTIHYSGLPIQASIGLLDATDRVYASQPTVRLSKHGVVLFELRDSKAHPLLFKKKDGSPLTYQGQLWGRQILITIDSPHFEATPIKNNLQWDHQLNKNIISHVAQDTGFINMLEKIKDHNNTKTDVEEKVITRTYQEKLEKLEIAVADDMNKMLNDNTITNLEYLSTSSNGKSEPSKIQKRKSNTPKTGSQQKNREKQPSVKINGKDYAFKIQWVKEGDNGLERMRSWMDIKEDEIIIYVNRAYAGYIDKFEKDEHREGVYLADTIGHTWQDKRFELVINKGEDITPDIVKEIQSDRDAAIARYMPIIAK